jgi:hypothetical protein
VVEIVSRKWGPRKMKGRSPLIQRAGVSGSVGRFCAGRLIAFSEKKTVASVPRFAANVFDRVENVACVLVSTISMTG